MIKPLAAVLAGIVISLFSTLAEACTYNRGTGQARPCPQRAAPLVVQPPPVIHGPRVWRPNVRQHRVHRGQRYRVAPQYSVRYGYRHRYRAHQHYAPPVRAGFGPPPIYRQQTMYSPASRAGGYSQTLCISHARWAQIASRPNPDDRCWHASTPGGVESPRFFSRCGTFAGKPGQAYGYRDPTTGYKVSVRF